MNWKEILKKNWKKGVLITFSVLFVCAAILFFYRARILQLVVREVITRVESKYPVKFTIQKADFNGFTTVRMEKVAMVPTGRDTLMQIRNIDADISLRSILFLRPVFNELTIEHAYLTALKHNGQDNFSFLLKKKSQAPRDTTKSRNYGELLNRLIETAFENVPDEVNFRQFSALYDSDNRKIRITMPQLLIEDGNIETNLVVETDSLVNRMRVSGFIDPDDYLISASLYATSAGGIQLPYVQDKFKARVAFDTLHISLDNKRFKRDRLTIQGNASVDNLLVNHAAIADNDVLVNKGSIDYVITLGENYYSLDTLSKVAVNKMVFYPQASLVTKPSRQISLKVRSAETEANDFFNSLPEGMFESFEGIKTQGFLTYNLNFFVDMAQVDSLKLESDLKARYFSILQYGKTDFRKINNTFEHTVYENGKPLRTFKVGPENPNFTPFDQISPYLKNAILTSEDPQFFRHKGFHKGAFRASMIANLKENRFARGGSTVSMQLVKNVFLTRKKTIARKVEEMLIVWLIENNRVVSKQRMYEVYLNIIEWGPNVYGVKEAANFFFSKHPSQLNLAESLYLTSIIPKPKSYRYSFDAYGNLRSRSRYYFRLIAGIMHKKGLISGNDYYSLYPAVNLQGRARSLIVTATPIDTTVVDSLDIDLENLNMDVPIDILD
ncbi:MAG: transglycosylase domain-containing protein [Adhaeribacter sp.]